jgi:hypothetical protein
MDTAGVAAIGTSAVSRDQMLRAAGARARRSAFYSQHLAGHELNGRADLGRLPLSSNLSRGAAAPSTPLSPNPIVSFDP